MQVTRTLSRRTSLACCLVLTAFAVGCAGGAAPLLTADPTGAALFEQGQDALVAEDWRDAVSAFDTLLRNYPSSPFMAEARLGMGRAYYEQARVESLIMAIDAFQAFLTYHPSHEFVDYAQYMVGMTYVAQMRTPDRDQAPTREAINAFEIFIASYPNSPLYDAAVRERLRGIDSLAQHEIEVASWESGRDLDWDAAIERVEYALEHYPETTLKCQLHFIWAKAYEQGEKLEDALQQFQRVIDEFPDCELVEEAEERIREINGNSLVAVVS